jgi:hypothetical protein
LFQTAIAWEIQKTSQPTIAAAKATCKAPTESLTMIFPQTELVAMRGAANRATRGTGAADSKQRVESKISEVSKDKK